MSSPDRPTPDWLLERVALGELPPDELQRARARIEAEPGGAERLAALEASSAEILQRHPPGRVAAEVARRAADRRQTRAPRRAIWWLAPALGAAAAAALTLVWIGRGSLGPAADGVEEPGETRLKGLQPHLLLFRQQQGPANPLADGAAAQPGEQVQIGYVAAGAAHGVALSIDGRGEVTLHHPATPGGSTALRPEGEVRLPFAYELDDAPGFERFFLITSEQPIEVDQVLDAARRLVATGGAARSQALPLTGLQQHSLTLVKPTK